MTNSEDRRDLSDFAVHSSFVIRTPESHFATGSNSSVELDKFPTKFGLKAATASD